MARNSRNSTVSVDAVAGILESLTLKNFMCHSFLEFNFSSGVNIIKGRNGSGKSAVLTAVIIGLGGSARITERGNSIKGLVQNGRGSATIEVVLRNVGIAYKPELYGERIIVERKLNASGGGSYKLKNHRGVVVSTKKMDLNRILDFFGIFLDNPLVILNQDKSKTFLQSANPNDLYSFYMECTQLARLHENVSTVRLHVEDCQKNMGLFNDRSKHVNREVEELRAKNEFIESFERNKMHLTQLENELEWAKILEEQGDLEKCMNKISNRESALNNIKEKFNKICGDEKEENVTLKAIQEELLALSKEIDEAYSEFCKHNQSSVKLKQKKRSLEDDIISLKREISKLKGDIRNIERVINEDQTSAMMQWTENEERRKELIARAEREVIELESAKNTEENHMQHLQLTCHNYLEEISDKQLEEKSLRRQSNNINKEIEDLKHSQGNKYSIFGYWIPKVLQEIEILHHQGRFGMKPVGPLGAYIKVRDKEWAHVAEHVIGRYLTVFSVASSKDYKILKQILDKVLQNKPKPQIVVAPFRQHLLNVERFEVVSNQYSSMWSILDISDVTVANTLIDQLQIESVLLIPSAEEASNLLMDRSTVPRNCKRAYTLRCDLFYPDPQYRIYSGSGQVVAKYLQVSMDDKLKFLKQNLDTVNNSLGEIQSVIHQNTSARDAIILQVNESKNKVANVKVRINKVSKEVAKLKAEQEPPPPDSSELDRVKQEYFSKAEDCNQRMAARKDDMKLIEEDLSNILEKQKVHDKKKSEANAKALQAKNKLEATENKITRLKNWKNIHIKKINEVEKLVTNNKCEAEKLKNALIHHLREAERACCPGIDTRRNSGEVQKEINNLNKYLEVESAELGDIDNIRHTYEEKERQLCKMAAEKEKLEETVEKARLCLFMREKKKQKIQGEKDKFFTIHFLRILAIKDLCGEVDIDHANKRLTVFVNRKFSSSQDVSRKTLAMLSGGERSFTTVSIILALWEMTESPFRMLDEFDIFMDIVSRRESLSMLVNAAKPYAQYILLTPLQVQSHENVTIYRIVSTSQQDDDC